MWSLRGHIKPMVVVLPLWVNASGCWFLLACGFEEQHQKSKRKQRERISTQMEKFSGLLRTSPCKVDRLKGPNVETQCSNDIVLFNSDLGIVMVTCGPAGHMWCDGQFWLTRKFQNKQNRLLFFNFPWWKQLNIRKQFKWDFNVKTINRTQHQSEVNWIR